MSMMWVVWTRFMQAGYLALSTCKIVIIMVNTADSTHLKLTNSVLDTSTKFVVSNKIVSKRFWINYIMCLSQYKNCSKNYKPVILVGQCAVVVFQTLILHYEDFVSLQADCSCGQPWLISGNKKLRTDGLFSLKLAAPESERYHYITKQFCEGKK